MQHIRTYLVAVVVVVVLAACATPPPTRLPTPRPILLPTPTSTPRPTGSAEEEEVNTLVEEFGHKLQMVSLLSPTAAQDIQAQYAPYVSPVLLEQWSSTPTQAPGRMVSSPWPDRIEIVSIEKTAPDEYAVGGFIMEVTSAEVANGGAANKIPIHLTVKNSDGKWLIAQYRQGDAQP